MEYFKNRENVDLYTSMMAEYSNNFVINEVRKVVSKGSSLLELGMGTGVDLIELSSDYNVIGSDSSHLFVEDFKKKSDIEVMILDAEDIKINRYFNCIYSNKVLQHLSKQGFIKSLYSQSRHLFTNGIIYATLWVGEYREELEFDGQLRCVYYNETILKNIIPNELQLEQLIYYSEFENNDSLIMILRKK